MKKSNSKAASQDAKNGGLKTVEKQSHTPGPWHCYQPENSPRQITDGQMRICTITDRSQAIANARLIAAAPELLAALKASVAIIQGWEQAAPIDIAFVADTARAVISSATGESVVQS